MKKYFLISLIFTSIYISAKSQKHKIEFGFLAGTNFSKANHVNNDILSGLNLGLQIKKNIAPNFSLKTIVAFDENNFAYRSLSFADPSSSTGLSFGDWIYKKYNLNLPLLAECSFGKSKNFYLDGGILIGYLLTEKQKTIAKSPTAYTSTSTTNNHTTNLGVSFGAGYKISISSTKKMGVGIRDNIDLKNKINSFSVFAEFWF